MFKTLFSLIIWPFASIVFLLLVIIYFFISIFIPTQKLYPLAKPVCRVILFCGGQWLKVKGNIPKKCNEPYLYLFNHGSLFDAFMIVASISHYVTAVGANKQFSWPIWGWIVKRYGVIPIKRKVLKEAIYSLDLAEKAIKNGVSFLISPEGTRTIDGKLGKFKKGPFHLAKNTGVTIVPIGLSGAFKAKKKPDWRIKPGILTLTFGKPIFGYEYQNMSLEELSIKIKKEMKNIIFY